MKEFRFRRRYQGPVRGVVLDWAGTAIDFGSLAPVSAFVAAFRACDVEVTLDEARRPMGMAKREHIQAVLRIPEVASRWQAVHGGASTEADVDRIFEHFIPAQKEVIASHTQLIPGCLDAVEYCRTHDVKIGSSTGYTQELMDLVVPLAAELGYAPDAIVCASDISPGRPAPWMCLEVVRRLGVYPICSVVKVDDTIVGIEAGLNAGTWTVGITKSGNLVGLSESDFAALPEAEQAARIASAEQQLLQVGAHYVIDSVAELPCVLEDINQRLQRGEMP